MKQLFVVTHTNRQCEIPASLDSWVTVNTVCQNVMSKKFALPYMFFKLTACLSVILLRICQVFFYILITNFCALIIIYS